ncbi:MAG: hypothetical protein L6R19_17470 [Alphaproteobacteria bacterium]|nr:hypothetical protein [Alphaproteobacteria bacterium]
MWETADAFSPFVWAEAIRAALSEVWPQLLMIAALLIALDLVLTAFFARWLKRRALGANDILPLNTPASDDVFELTDRVDESGVFARMADQMAACLSEARGECCPVLPPSIKLAPRPILVSPTFTWDASGWRLDAFSMQTNRPTPSAA